MVLFPFFIDVLVYFKERSGSILAFSTCCSIYKLCGYFSIRGRVMTVRVMARITE